MEKQMNSDTVPIISIIWVLNALMFRQNPEGLKAF